MEEKKTATEKPLMNSLDNSSNKFFSTKLIAALVVVIILGVGTGYFISKKTGTISNYNTSTSGNGSKAQTGTTVGSSDTSTFKDIAEGELKEGGIEGEGQFHLARTGGESQNVYLTSSIVDLSQYLNKKVKVWGQTQAAKHAGWLMDVGRLEVK